MAEDLKIASNATKEQKYQELLPQIKALAEGENNVIANLSNISAALKQTFSFWWVGFYLVENNELVLGPFQGPVACTRIPFGKGVCGTAFAKKNTILVPDVEQFPGHIACSADSKSEIVVPIIKNNEVIMILDIDSSALNDFDHTDQTYLEQLAEFIAKIA
ncbi:GAF domain-containing protein [Catalinimonas sp. 4WD22]|uniref:GAF domain-containing protein n=1 Tax=Catalinimonas locisalis TaxID=3133978 RepID=UPI0031016F7E